jgi:preprotein translocase subunit YajC
MMKFNLKGILLIVIFVIGGVMVMKFLIGPQRQGIEKIEEKSVGDFRNFSKVHIHEIYDEYQKDPEGAIKKWMGQHVISIGFAAMRPEKNEIVIHPSIYIVREIGVLASCPWKDKKLIEKIKSGDNFLAISGRINKMEILEGSTSGGFPPIAFGPPQYLKFFELGLRDYNLIDKGQVRELKANFSK